MMNIKKFMDILKIQEWVNQWRLVLKKTLLNIFTCAYWIKKMIKLQKLWINKRSKDLLAELREATEKDKLKPVKGMRSLNGSYCMIVSVSLSKSRLKKLDMGHTVQLSARSLNGNQTLIVHPLTHKNKVADFI